MKFSERKKNILVIVAVVILTLSALLPIPKKEVEAIGLGEILGGAGTAAIYCTGILDELGGFLRGLNPFGSVLGSVPVKEDQLRTKEGCFDHLAFVAANIFIEETLRETVRWINGDTGDDGARYVEDLEGFLTDTTDKAIGEFIYGTDLGFVCSPFRLDLRIALAKSYIPERRVQCTLSEISENVENFLGGDFYDGGWNAWNELVTRSNPYSQYIAAQSALEARINARRDQELAKITWGDGFFAWETCPGNAYQCVGVGPPGSDGFGGNSTVYLASDKNDCEQNFPAVWQCSQPLVTNTPGSVINNQLNKVLGSGQNRLEQADEINEVISALLNKFLTKNVFNRRGLSRADLTDEDSTDIITGEDGGGRDICARYGICDPLGQCIAACELEFECTEEEGPFGESCNEEDLFSCIAQCEIDFPRDDGGGPGDGEGSGSCADDGTGIADYGGTLQAAIDNVNSRNPNGVADLPNTTSGALAYLDEVIKTLSGQFGLSASTDVLNGNDNPNSGDLIAIWSSEDSEMERYDAVIGVGSGSDIMRNVADAGQFTGDIPFSCLNIEDDNGDDNNSPPGEIPTP